MIQKCQKSIVGPFASQKLMYAPFLAWLVLTVHTWVKDFTSIAQLLIHLMKADVLFAWVAEHQHMMNCLKEAIATSLVIWLINYISSNKVFLSVDSSHIAVGYILS